MNLLPDWRDGWCVWLVKRMPTRLVYGTLNRFLKEAGVQDAEAAKLLRRWPGTRAIIRGRQ